LKIKSKIKNNKERTYSVVVKSLHVKYKLHLKLKYEHICKKAMKRMCNLQDRMFKINPIEEIGRKNQGKYVLLTL
jgi:hypothetical protein